MKWMLLLALLVPQDSLKEKEIENKIANVKITVDFQNATLSSVIDYIREIADINVIIDGRTDAAEHIVTIKVQQLAVRSVLKLMMAGTDYGYTYQDGVLMITTTEHINKKLKLELYDIRDILYPLKDFPGVDITLAQDSLGTTFGLGGDGDESEPLPVEEMVTTHTGNGFWDENSDASCVLNNGILVIKATKPVHKQVRRLLNMLRRNK